MSESYFAKLANEILDASEKLTTRFEEGLNVLLGELDKTSDTAQQPPLEAGSENEFEGWDEEMMDDPSPLAGIAESVMGDIMASQVCLFVCKDGHQKSPMTDERTTQNAK